MEKKFILNEEEKSYCNDKTVRKIAILEKLKLLNIYIDVKEKYAKKHIDEMNRIDNILITAPNPMCKTYIQADRLTDESFKHYAKAKRLNALCSCAKRYKEYKGEKNEKEKQKETI